MAARIRRIRVRPLVAVVAVIVLAVAGATAAFAATSTSGHAYRTATVSRGSVAQQLGGSGTIQPVAQAAVAFPIAGSVSTVDVAVGGHVAVGQKLATLDAASLEQNVVEKQATLAAANLTLYKALNGESVSATGSSRASTNGADATTTAATTTASNNVTSGANTATGGASSAIAAAERQIVDAQQKVDGALAAVQTALGSASTACDIAAPKPTPTPTRAGSVPGSSTPPRGLTSAPSTTTTTTVPPTSKPATAGLGTAACIAAQRQVLTAQQTLASAQQSLASAEQAFERAAGAVTTTSPTTGTGTGTSSSASASSAASTVSAAQLVADQAAVDAAATDVLAAQEAVEQATVTSPIAGTVAAVSLVVGQSVTASSSTATIVVVGTGGYEIATTVGVNDIGKVKLGEAATVVPDGGTAAMTGQVVWIGAASSSSSSSTTYPVVIGLSTSATSGSAVLRSGALASTSIELAHTAAALTVPTSAVHTTNGLHLVTVLANGKTSSVRVQIGVVGAESTQITSGLSAGEVVVLADLHAAVPSSNTSSRVVNSITGGGTGNGALGGGGLGG